MENWYIAIILSIVEGLTEFLPVSSTGHLILAGDMLGFKGEKAATFQVIIQLGAIMAVVVLYWSRFWGLLVPQKNTGTLPHFSGLRGIGLLILTCIPACVLGLLLHSYIKAYLFTPLTVLMALVVGALFMIIVEKRIMLFPLKSHDKNKSSENLHKISDTLDNAGDSLGTERLLTIDDIKAKDAFIIGCFQCLALWPGFSRSASTIMGGMLLGANRKLSAEYSFIAAVPIMVAATGYDLLKSWHILSADDVTFFALGIVASFVAALIAIKTFVALLARITLIPFAIYRLILAPLVYYFMVY